MCEISNPKVHGFKDGIFRISPIVAFLAPTHNLCLEQNSIPIFHMKISNYSSRYLIYITCAFVFRWDVLTCIVF